MEFEIQFSPHAQEHVKKLRKRDQQIILEAIAVNLHHQPDKQTKNRKLLEENPLAPWELRVGEFRVFYDVNQTENLVIIVAVGKKKHNELWIGNEQVDL
jgi:mRNA-degrading endonuclease RelE of RelBE toxin-antitoxin system